jgi:hypothetical protein
MAHTADGLMACKRLGLGVTRRPLRFLVAVCRLVFDRIGRPLEPADHSYRPALGSRCR